MTSCAVSCCICFPKVSCVSATSVFSPTASVPPRCRSASNHWRQRHNSNSSQILPPSSSAIPGAALYVVPRWRASKRSRLLRFNFVLHRWPHETTLANSNSLRASACSASLYFAPNKSLSHLLHLRSRQHHLSPPTPLPHRLTGALHYGTVWAHLNTAPSHH